MNFMNNKDAVEENYKNSGNLQTRINLHKKYSINKYGWSNWIFDQYDFFDGCSILELGCGTGEMWVNKTDMIGKGSRLVLSDFSESMLSATKQNVKSQENICFEHINIEQIPYDDNTFDFVLANSMLYHVPDIEKGIREVRRVLKEEGTFYTTTFGENGISRFIYNTCKHFEIHNEHALPFTLQNGEAQLKKSFQNVSMIEYIDGFEITDVNDLTDYIFSMTSMSDIVGMLDKKDMTIYFEGMKDEEGILKIPKELGMFTASNYEKKGQIGIGKGGALHGIYLR